MLSNSDEEAALIHSVSGTTGLVGKRLVAKLVEKPTANACFLPRDKSPERPDALDDSTYGFHRSQK